MDVRMQDFLDKIRVMADKTSKAASRAADVAGKKAGELATATRLNLQIFDLNTECEVLYKEIGRQIYELHRGVEPDNDVMDNRIAQIDDKQEKVAALREELASLKSVAVCPHCGKHCSKEDAFCAGCGGAL